MYQAMQIPTKKLSNGLEIPVLGLGTWMIKDENEVQTAVLAALEAGYRHIDSAQIYENEAAVGAALARSGTPRNELFITTKLWNDNQFFDDVIPSFEQSLKNLQTDYVDLFLVHFPVTETRDAAWVKMEELYRSGKVRAIGVSNYAERHLDELLNKYDIPPVINQVEIHPFLTQEPLRNYCKEKGIAVEAYSSLAHGYDMTNEVIAEVAKKHVKSYAQIMLRWAIQHDLIVLPKSTQKDRIQENAQLFDFEIDADDMAKIDGLNKNLRTCWNPVNIP